MRLAKEKKMNFWDVHGVWFIIFMFFFPRLTLLFSSVAFGGFFWWLGFIFTPRLLVAVLATLAYWTTNPVLCVCAWVWVFWGEGTEKTIVANKIKKGGKNDA